MGKAMHVTWVNVNAGFVGGAERYVADTARRLRDEGIRATLLYEVGGELDPAFISCFDGAFPWVDAQAQLRDLNPDVVYAHRLSRESAISQLECGPPVVRFHHDHKLLCLREFKYTTLGHKTCTKTVGSSCYPCLGFLQKAPGRIPVKLRTVGSLRADQRAHYGLSAHVVGSRYMREHLVAHGFPEERVHVIHPFVEPPEPDAQQEPRDPNLILFVGAVLRGKGVDVLLHALNLLPDPLRLVVCGAGHQEPLFKALAEKLGVAHRVQWLGRVPRDELDRWYQRAACLVVPSREPETFCLVGPEAMLRGTPVCVSRVGGTGEWALDGETAFLFDSGDAQGLADAVRRVTGDPQTALAMAQWGSKMAREQFTAQEHTKKLAELLRNVAGH